MGLREQLAEAFAPPEKEVTIAGQTFKLVGLTFDEKYKLAHIEDPVEGGFWALERMIRDMDGARVFEDGDPMLRTMDERVFDQLGELGKKLMSTDAAAKNSEAAHTSGD